MSDELAVPAGTAMVQTGVTQEQIEQVAAASEYLKRIQLMGSNNEAVKEGKIGMGNYALVTDKLTMKDLGSSVDVLVCGMRLKAMQLTDEGEVINSYDPNESEFCRIREGSADTNSGCMCGLDFLFWLPSESQFVTFYMCSKSARRESPNIRAKMDEAKGVPGPATLGSKLAKTKKYSWHVTTTHECTTPFAMPSNEDYAEQLVKFLNPPKNEAETVKDNTTRER